MNNNGSVKKIRSFFRVKYNQYFKFNKKYWFESWREARQRYYDMQHDVWNYTHCDNVHPDKPMLFNRLKEWSEKELHES